MKSIVRKPIMAKTGTAENGDCTGGEDGRLGLSPLSAHFRPGRKPIMVANLEEGFPGVEEARALLRQAIHTAHIAHVVVLTIIHGYGSTGMGGKLRWKLRRSLRKMSAAGVIGDFIPGEQFSESDVRTQTALIRHPFLMEDPNLNSGNMGVTLIFLNPHPLDPAFEYARAAKTGIGEKRGLAEAEKSGEVSGHAFAKPLFSRKEHLF